ncbi:MAG: hypothetical protein PHQ43_14950 [Dehalococcoidales bacterium]|nr:hypothetical protein [Dehalococcoidales bacterium]
MPWQGDQFEYTRGYIRFLLETFFERQEEVRRVSRDPFRSSAMPYYDMLCALDGVTFTKKQWEAFYMRLCGHTQFEIAAALGISRRSTRDRISSAEEKVMGFFERHTAIRPLPRG